MKLTYPKTTNEWQAWNKKVYPAIPDRSWVASGYFMLACGEHGHDVYVAFTDKTKGEVWIEKTSVLMGKRMLVVEDLVRIDNDEEFTFAHRFFINQGLLDGTKES